MKTNNSLSNNNLNSKYLLKGTVISMTTLLLAATLIAPAQAKNITPSTAHYKFSVKDKISGNGTATRTLKKSGNVWSYKTRARALGGVAKANQSTSFVLKNNKVKPTSAKTSYKVLGVSNAHKIKYSGKSVLSTYKKKTKKLTMKRQAYDDLSLEVQIRQDLLNNKFTGNYYMVKKNKIVKTKFKKSGTSQIKTPSGTYKVIRIDRVHSNPKQQTSFWLAPSLDYLPVKVITKKKGKRVKLELTKVS